MLISQIFFSKIRILSSSTVKYALYKYTQNINIKFYNVNIMTYSTLNSTKSMSSRFQKYSTKYAERSKMSENNYVQFKTNKILNNVIIYKYENNFFFRLITVFGVVQFVSLWFAAINMYTVTSDSIFKKYATLQEKLGSIILPIGMIAFLTLCAPLLATFIWFANKRSIKYLFLLKGGNKVQFITYHPIKSEQALTFPIESVNCITSRKDMGNYIKLNVKNIPFPFIVDKNGNFPNPELFDQTVGINRQI